jgi:tripartite-type tricarboxylate transporter receptor subunit TctC
MPVKLPTQRRALCTAIALGALLCSAPVGAQSAWPTKPIRWVVPFPAGGGTDQTSRVLAEKLSAVLGQPVLVENKPGANTLIGAQAVAAAPADGHTVLFATPGTLCVVPHMYPKLPYATDALVPVAQLVRFPLFLMVGAEGPLATPAKFLATAKAGQLQYAIGGSGTLGHLGTELMARKLGVSMQAVPFKAIVQAAPEVAAGRVPFMFADLPGALPYVQGGRAKILATAGKTRSPLYPDAPTLSEAGIADLSFETWAGLVVAKGTPQGVVDRLSDELNKILGDPAVRAKLAISGVEPAPSGQAEFIHFIAAESARWAPVVKSAGIKPE